MPDCVAQSSERWHVCTAGLCVLVTHVSSWLCSHPVRTANTSVAHAVSAKQRSRGQSRLCFTAAQERHFILELWLFGGNHCKTGSGFILPIKMINSVTNNATKQLNLPPFNVWIDRTLRTGFVSICCKLKLDQIMHWSYTCGGIHHSFIDDDKLMSKSESTVAQRILFYINVFNIWGPRSRRRSVCTPIKGLGALS